MSNEPFSYNPIQIDDTIFGKNIPHGVPREEQEITCRIASHKAHNMAPDDLLSLIMFIDIICDQTFDNNTIEQYNNMINNILRQNNEIITKRKINNNNDYRYCISTIDWYDRLLSIRCDKIFLPTWYVPNDVCVVSEFNRRFNFDIMINNLEQNKILDVTEEP